MTEQYGQSQIKEVSFSKEDIKRILIENIKARHITPYDFDYDNPVVLFGQNGSIIFRYVQTKITKDEKPRDFYLRPIAKS